MWAVCRFLEPSFHLMSAHLKGHRRVPQLKTGLISVSFQVPLGLLLNHLHLVAIMMMMVIALMLIVMRVIKCQIDLGGMAMLHGGGGQCRVGKILCNARGQIWADTRGDTHTQPNWRKKDSWSLHSSTSHSCVCPLAHLPIFVDASTLMMMMMKPFRCPWFNWSYLKVVNTQKLTM